MARLHWLGIGQAAALAALALAGCGGDDEGAGAGGTGGSGAAGASGLGEQYASAICGRLYNCCDAAEIVDALKSTYIQDYAGCRIAYRTLWEGYTAGFIADSEAAGRLAFDEAAYSACLADVAAQPCSADPILDVACQAAFTPKVPAGGACSQGVECTTGRCIVPSGANEGACVDPATLPGLGEPCPDNACAEGLYCFAQTCAAPQPDGSACSDDEACESRVCVGEETGQGQCGRTCDGGGPGVGPTDPDLEAIGGPIVLAICGKVFDCCTAAEALESPALGLPGLDTEADCRAWTAVIYGLLALPVVHNAALLGTVEVDATAMRACVDAHEARSCADYAASPSLDCLEEALTGTVADAGVCTSGIECVSGYCEKPMPDPMTQGTCVQPPAVGDPCGSECAEGSYCDAGVCQAEKPLGSACGASSECLEGACVGDTATDPGTCTLICDGI